MPAIFFGDGSTMPALEDSTVTRELAIPTPVYYLPLIYTFGATEGGKPFVFNNSCEYGSATMTGFAFGIGDK